VPVESLSAAEPVVPVESVDPPVSSPVDVEDIVDAPLVDDGSVLVPAPVMELLPVSNPVPTESASTGDPAHPPSSTHVTATSATMDPRPMLEQACPHPQIPSTRP
jgi:hypothetical protein